MNQAKSANRLRGLYHFAENDGDLAGEADHFLATVKPQIGQALLVLDWEQRNLANVSGAKAWLDRVYGKTGVKPLIYMSQSVANGHDWSPVVKAGYGLWAARYNDTLGPTGAWKSVTMWQYTSSHQAAGGYRVDANHFYGTKADWNALASGKSGGTSGGGDDMATGDSGVWDDQIFKWQPGQKGGDDTLPAGQQLNQARGYSYDADVQAKKIKAALKALAQAQDDKTKKAMLDALD